MAMSEIGYHVLRYSRCMRACLRDMLVVLKVAAVVAAAVFLVWIGRQSASPGCMPIDEIPVRLAGFEFKIPVILQPDLFPWRENRSVRKRDKLGWGYQEYCKFDAQHFEDVTQVRIGGRGIAALTARDPARFPALIGFDKLMTNAPFEPIVLDAQPWRFPFPGMRSLPTVGDADSARGQFIQLSEDRYQYTLVSSVPMLFGRQVWATCRKGSPNSRSKLEDACRIYGQTPEGLGMRLFLFSGDVPVGSWPDVLMQMEELLRSASIVGPNKTDTERTQN